MRVFVAGATGAIGRRLVPQLVAHGHQVVASAQMRVALVRSVVCGSIDGAVTNRAARAAR